jgi:hypothetical protein
VKIKLEVYLIFIGTLVMAASSYVLIDDTSRDTEVLGGIGLLGGIAIIITSTIQMLSNRNGNGRNGGNGGKLRWRIIPARSREERKCLQDGEYETATITPSRKRSAAKSR